MFVVVLFVVLSFSDKRFGKLTEDKRHSAPSIMDYLKKKITKLPKVDNASMNFGEDSVDKDDINGRRLIIRYGTDKVSYFTAIICRYWI